MEIKSICIQISSNNSHKLHNTTRQVTQVVMGVGQGLRDRKLFMCMCSLVNMEGKIGMNILVREEESEDGKVFVVNSEELGVSDFGVTLDEAIENFRKSVAMYLEVYPEKKELLVVQGKKPLLMSRIFL